LYLASGKIIAKGMKEVNIPVPARSGFKTLFQLDYVKLDKLYEILQAVGPVHDPEILAQENHAILGLTELDATKLFFSIFSLLKFKDSSERPEENLITELLAAIQNIDDLKINDEDTIRKIIKRIFDIGHSISFNIKYRVLKSEYQFMFKEIRVLADIRPIFSTDVNADINFFISHSIKIVYEALSEYKEIYIKSNYDDLLNIKTQIDRAIKKHEILKQKMNNTEIEILS
jgi:hypothetical protein